MCRLLGAIASKPVDLEYLLATGPRPFRDLGGRKAPDWATSFHPHGWGIGWYAGAGRLFKETVPAAKSNELPRLAAEARSRIILCHVRKASQGAKTEQNCHPFRHGNWLFAHNGTVACDPLHGKLYEGHRAAIEGTTDSEVFFHRVLQNIEEHPGNVEIGIRRALDEVRKYDFSAMNFLLTDGESLYAFRHSTRDQDYYSLRYLALDAWPRSEEGAPTPQATDGPFGSATPGLKAILVCSERLTDDAWVCIPLGHLLIVSPRIDCRLVSVLGHGR